MAGDQAGHERAVTVRVEVRRGSGACDSNDRSGPLMILPGVARPSTGDTPVSIIATSTPGAGVARRSTKLGAPMIAVVFAIEYGSIVPGRTSSLRPGSVLHRPPNRPPPPHPPRRTGPRRERSTPAYGQNPTTCSKETTERTATRTSPTPASTVRVVDVGFATDSPPARRPHCSRRINVPSGRELRNVTTRTVGSATESDRWHIALPLADARRSISMRRVSRSILFGVHAHSDAKSRLRSRAFPSSCCCRAPRCRRFVAPRWPVGTDGRGGDRFATDCRSA